MRSYDMNDEHNAKQIQKERIEPWMLRCLDMNPDYVHWGPYEEFMCEDGKWTGPIISESWADFGPVGLNDLNECVNFYFYAERDSEECPECEGTGLNPKTKQVSDDFYDFAGKEQWVRSARASKGKPENRQWHNAITQDEADVLWEKERLWGFKEKPTAEQVNASKYQHDAINRCILIEVRAKRLGVYGHCRCCDGRGHVYTSETARLGLVLWMLHPRKGASRGVDIRNVRQDELPTVLAWLRQAAERNAQRFAGLKEAP